MKGLSPPPSPFVCLCIPAACTCIAWTSLHVNHILTMCIRLRCVCMYTSVYVCTYVHVCDVWHILVCHNLCISFSNLQQSIPTECHSTADRSR